MFDGQTQFSSLQRLLEEKLKEKLGYIFVSYL